MHALRATLTCATAALFAVGCGASAPSASSGPSDVPPRDIITTVVEALQVDTPITLKAEFTTSGARKTSVRTSFDLTMNRTGLRLVMTDTATAGATPRVRELVVTDAGQDFREGNGRWVRDVDMPMQVTRDALAELARPDAEVSRARTTLIGTLVSVAPTGAVQTAGGEHCLQGPMNLAPLGKDDLWGRVKSATMDFCVTRDGSGRLRPAHATLTYAAPDNASGTISAAIDDSAPTIAAPRESTVDKDQASQIGGAMFTVGLAAVVGPLIDPSLTAEWMDDGADSGAFGGVITGP